jgi:hypothetical protein
LAFTISHRGQPPTTSGVIGLNFCVRHGNRCISYAMNTKSWSECIEHSKLNNNLLINK